MRLVRARVGPSMVLRLTLCGRERMAKKPLVLLVAVPLEVALKRATTVVARQTQHTQRPSYRCTLGWDDGAGAPLVL